jgi:tetratricopeptide (TPR) repeat protein
MAKQAKQAKQATQVAPVLIAWLVALGVCAGLSAQTQPPQAGRGGQGPRNLQVLPKDTSQQDVVAVMQQFTRALGVPCTYCHVEVTAPLLTAEEAAAAAAAAPPAAGRGRGRGRGAGPQMDFASDDKRQKQTARLMLTLVNDINARLATTIRKPASEIVRVQCATCHRGIANPAQLADLLRQTMLGKGESAAVAQYRDLRQGYLSSGAYDFGEPVLLDLGRESLATRKPDDAVAWLQLNLEFYPKSVASWIALSQAHEAKRDHDAARSDLQKALALEPANADARRLLRAMPK